ncbi:hypothetical protein [[Mycobacterium] zoologicum]|uniref:hypothetical protein n=1 Tax=[Mycobacterium] zoologicum TaxID=2872311 RepID=UPI001CDAE7FC|nr:hypothetical protein [Mycolicibacter sp. MYC101]MEB3062621.1 hypothetical protein [Mycolicibacter sp. MYC101]
MGTSTRSAHTTRLFARVIGPFLAIMMATAAIQAPKLWPQASSWAADSLVTWSIGAFTLIAGLVVVALHPYWRGIAAFSISALGWLTAVKGASLVAFPTALLSLPADTMGSIWVFRIVYAVFAVLGLYLTWVGWAPGEHGHAAPEGKADGVLRRAA